MTEVNDARLAHREVMAKINSTTEVKDLPKVGLTVLNQKILRAVNSTSTKKDFKTGDIKELSDAYLANAPLTTKEAIVKKITNIPGIDEETQQQMRTQIINKLFDDESINFVVDEIHAKEDRKLKIYKTKHEETMDAISKANRIADLPQGLVPSLVNTYLNGNTTIYSKDDRINADDLKPLANLLMDDHKWEDEVVQEEVKRLATEKYPEKEDAFELLYAKLSKLPRTYYFVEELKYSLKRQEEFIGRGCSYVNVYFVPNYKNKIPSGRFYNCYINRVDKLDLSQILPLNLQEIVSDGTDIDQVEQIVQEEDPTFKLAGGIILNKDEDIGDISIFKPNDGKVGVSPAEKERIEQIDSLYSEIKSKLEKVTYLDAEIAEKEAKVVDINSRMRKIILDYEKQALELQSQLMTNISVLKTEAGLDAEEQKPEGKELK